MKFNISVVDPKGYPYTHFLYNTCKLLNYGLESLGHDCCITRNHLDASRMTILIGGHLLNSLDVIDQIARAGPYIVLQSEAIQSAIVNQAMYVPLLQRARSVWEGIPDQLAPLALLGARPQLLLAGYHPRMEEIAAKNNRDIDFLFFGSITPHRQTMFDQLRQRGCEVVTMFDEDAIFRDDMIARTKVHLAPRQSDAMNHLPYVRICYLLNNRGLCVVERCRDQEWLQDCFLWAESSRWVDLCEQTLRRPGREQLATEFYERYKRTPFTDYLEKVLEDL
jgi:hypothetical protein